MSGGELLQVIGALALGQNNGSTLEDIFTVIRTVGGKNELNKTQVESALKGGKETGIFKQIGNVYRMNLEGWNAGTGCSCSPCLPQDSDIQIIDQQVSIQRRSRSCCRSKRARCCPPRPCCCNSCCP